MRNVNEDNGVSRVRNFSRRILVKLLRWIFAILVSYSRFFFIFGTVEDCRGNFISLLMTNLEICIIYKTRFDIGLNVCPNVK